MLADIKCENSCSPCLKNYNIFPLKAQNCFIEGYVIHKQYKPQKVA